MACLLAQVCAQQVKHRMNQWFQERHRCIGCTMFQRRCQVRKSQVFSTGWTGEASVHTIGVMTSAVRSSTATPGYEWPDEPTLPQPEASVHPMIRRFLLTVGATAPRLGGLYIWHPPTIWSLLEFKEVTYTPKNHSKPSRRSSSKLQEQSICCPHQNNYVIAHYEPVTLWFYPYFILYTHGL